MILQEILVMTILILTIVGPIPLAWALNKFWFWKEEEDER